MNKKYEFWLKFLSVVFAITMIASLACMTISATKTESRTYNNSRTSYTTISVCEKNNCDNTQKPICIKFA